MLFESKGLHHHTKRICEEVIGALVSIMPDVQEKIWNLEYVYTEKTRTSNVQKERRWRLRPAAGQTEDFPLSMAYLFICFALPTRKGGGMSIFLYRVRLEHSGNGFVYLNGHCIGRCWQKGPQYEYYLPECWLNLGGENHLAISLRPTAEWSGGTESAAQDRNLDWADEDSDVQSIHGKICLLLPGVR